MVRVLAQLLIVVTAMMGCSGPQEVFIGTRVEDRCEGEWPVCSTTIGCFVGDKSYVAGRFPGANKVAIRVFEPSTVTVSMFLSEVSAAGEKTVVTIYEDACRARTRTEIPGKTFVTEWEKTGVFSRSADVSGVGDHLIEVESDARTKYLLKVDVLPLRLKDAQQ